jgi:serine/threonine-protein kinase
MATPMVRPDQQDAELKVALAHGVLTMAEADGLRDEARRAAQSPLRLLVERGRLSDQTYVSLAREAEEVAAGPAPRAVEDGPTLARSAERPAAAASPPAGTDSGPVPGWDRYRFIRLLGEGGMGRVFLAYDPRLQRNVALKFVRDGNPELDRRFAFEARAQARIDHPSVGKVYEVGEVGGRPYIAMQFVDGKPLHEAASGLGLERKVILLRDAARGVQEAHRSGVIHRDIKPSNLMVEASPSGDLRLFVMDFGLARDWSATATATGSVLGTPHYMAPEQARGEVATLDRRVDVYALGATLYHVLCGQPPIPGGNALEVLSNVPEVPPRPLRAAAPDVPADLQAVVMKCLEKDRSDRYDSARALADDLDRFLAGEPVLARAHGPWERLRRSLRKNRRLAAISGAALVAVLVAIGWGLRLRQEASRREGFARRFTEVAERVEADARYADLSPLHDITADLAALKARMAALEVEVAGGGAAAQGPGRYALGRGALALGDVRAAHQHLQAAWEAGFREPWVAYALALVNGRLYREGLQEAERVEGRDIRETTRRELERAYREPALAFLRQSEGAKIPSTHYVSALVAFYEDRLDDALGHLERLGMSLPWFYEAPLLEAQILGARATRLAEAGEHQRAAQDFDRARAAVAVAASIGESAPAVHLAMAQLEYAAMRAALYGKGDLQGPFHRGLEAIRRALRASPGNVEARVLEASFHRRMAERRSSQGAEVDELLERARGAAEAAVAAAPGHPQATLELARVLSQWAQARSARFSDPSPLLDAALRLVGDGSPLPRDYHLHMLLGNIHKTRAEHEEQIGADSSASRNRCIEAYLAATQLDERSALAWSNLGDGYKARASRPNALTPVEDLHLASQALERARSLSPANVSTYLRLGRLREEMANHERARGEDPRPLLMEALQMYEAGAKINSSLPHFPNGRGSALISLAHDEWNRGGDPMAPLEEARRAFEQAIQLAPSQGYGQGNLGNVLGERASFEIKLGKDPTPSLDRAERAIQEAVRHIPDHAATWANLGSVLLLRARWEASTARDPSARLKAAEEALATALKLNPREDTAWGYRGEGRALRADWRATRSLPFDADFEEAAAALTRAAELAPKSPGHRLALAECLHTWWRWRRRAGRDGGDRLEQAAAAAEQALAARPGWPEAAAIRAAIRVAAADEQEPRRRLEMLEQARRELESALRRNPHLKLRWAHALAELVAP